MDVQIDFHAIPTTCAAMHWWRSRLFFMFDIYKAFYKILVKTLWNGKQWHKKFKMAAITCRRKYIQLKPLDFCVTDFVQPSLHV